jgi:hypothetical protein
MRIVYSRVAASLIDNDPRLNSYPSRKKRRSKTPTLLNDTIELLFDFFCRRFFLAVILRCASFFAFFRVLFVTACAFVGVLVVPASARTCFKVTPKWEKSNGGERAENWARVRWVNLSAQSDCSISVRPLLKCLPDGEARPLHGPVMRYGTLTRSITETFLVKNL